MTVRWGVLSTSRKVVGSAEGGVPVEIEPSGIFPIPASHWSDA